MAKYRKKPRVIDAIQYDGENAESLLDWINEHADTETAYLAPSSAFGPDALIIPTLEGDHRADINDWIICGVNGEFYPCKPDIFEQTYEPAGADT